MELSFLTPGWALLGLAVMAPLAGALAIEARAREVRRHLALTAPPRPALAVVPLALVVLAAFVGIAAAQPVLQRSERSSVRADVEAFVLVDVSRSMLAAPAPEEPSRFARARAAALRIRAAIPDVRVGIASLTDRSLPHLFPTSDRRAFAATLARAVEPGRPQPQSSAPRATAIDALSAVATQNFFAESARRRVVAVLTDGESRAIDIPALRGILGDARPVQFVFVHVTSPGERVFGGDGRVEAAYRPDPASAAALEGLATAIAGRAFSEQRLDEAVEAIREAVGEGEVARRTERTSAVPLAPVALAVAFVPLAALLGRRNRA